MDILLIFDHYHPYVGGAEVLNRRLAEHLARSHNVTVIARSHAVGLCGEEVINNVRIIRTAGPRWLHSFAAVRKALTKVEKWDVILSATYASALAGYWLSKITHKRSIALVYEILGKNWEQAGKKAFGYWAFEKFVVTRSFDRYISISRYTAGSLEKMGIPSSKIEIIYCGVDGYHFRSRPVDPAIRDQLAGPEELIYFYFGRPGITKGVRYLVEAVQDISDKVANSRLVLMLGQEPREEYKKIIQLIKRLGIGDKVKIINPVVDESLPDYVNAADVVVVPSISEGFGLSAAEACRLGKPVVATRAGALPEVLSGRTVLVEPADPAAIARGVISAFRGDYKTTPVKSFDWGKSLEEYERVICQ
jgi:glycosyltransferase involved in cell wall biosynthesis